MKSLARLICFIWLPTLLVTVAEGGQHNLRFVDQTGQPIPDVVVRYSYRADPIYPGGGRTGELASDTDGRLTIAHPCSTPGSCCVLVSEVAYQVIGKFGYDLSGTGTVPCGVGPNIDITIIGSGQAYPRLALVSAASYRELLTGEMIVAAFGNNLAPATTAAALPLPPLLGGRQVFIRNADGAEQAAPLVFVSSSQINFIMPTQELIPALETSLRTVIIKDENNQVVSTGIFRAAAVAPGIFTANADGQGVPAAMILRVQPGGVQSYEPLAQFDAAQNRFVPLAIDLGPEQESIVLVLFGTGWRQVHAPAAVNVKIGGIDSPVEYVGSQPAIAGLDQLNVRLPRALLGKGEAIVEVTIQQQRTNMVQIKIK